MLKVALPRERPAPPSVKAPEPVTCNFAFDDRWPLLNEDLLHSWGINCTVSSSESLRTIARLIAVEIRQVPLTELTLIRTPLAYSHRRMSLEQDGNGIGS